MPQSSNKLFPDYRMLSSLKPNGLEYNSEEGACVLSPRTKPAKTLQFIGA